LKARHVGPATLPFPCRGSHCQLWQVILSGQREQAILLSDLDKSRQPAADKSRASSGKAPATPSSVNGAQCLRQRSAEKLLRQPDFASIATAIASTVANVDAIFIPALLLIQEKDTDEGEEHGTNSLGGGVAEDTNVVDETTNVAPAEVDKELGDLVCLPSMFNGERMIDDPHFVCAALKLCQSVGNQTSMMSICINCNLSAHHFCTEYLYEQSPVKEHLYMTPTDFTKDGKIRYRKFPKPKKLGYVLYLLPVQMESN
jgi:hypothetical protein